MSDWSSDVCSSVLFLEGRLPVIAQWQAMGAAPAPAADERPARAGKSDADALTAWLIGWLSDRLNLPAAAIDASRGFAEMGLDSLGSTELAFELGRQIRSEEQTYELQSLMRHSYAVFC